jgi:hypothetical protein
MFTNVFEREFIKIADLFRFFCFRFHIFFYISHSFKFKIDVMNLENPIVFKSESTEKFFIKCSEREF